MSLPALLAPFGSSLAHFSPWPCRSPRLQWCLATSRGTAEVPCAMKERSVICGSYL